MGKQQRCLRVIWLQHLFISCLLLGNWKGVVTSPVEDQLEFTTVKDQHKITESIHPTELDDQSFPTEGPSPDKTSQQANSGPTEDGGEEPRDPTTQPQKVSTKTQDGRNTTTPWTTPGTITVVQVVTDQVVTTQIPTDQVVTTQVVTTGTLSSTTQQQTAFVTSISTDLQQTTVGVSSPSTTSAVSTTVPQTTPGHTTQPSTHGPPQTTPQPPSPPSTELPWPTTRHPPYLTTSRSPTEGPPPSHTEAPPHHTEKPPPTKPYKPTRPHSSDRPRLTTVANPHLTTPKVWPSRPTRATSMAHNTIITQTNQPYTHNTVPYPDIIVQLFLQIAWNDLCLDIESLRTSIAEFTKMSLDLSYLPLVKFLNEKPHCPQIAKKKRDTLDEVQLDICILSRGLCNSRLTDDTGVAMQADLDGLQKFLKPEVVSVNVYRSPQATPNPRSTSSPETGVAIGLSFSFLLTATVASLVVYKMHKLRLSKKRALHNRYYFDGTQLHDTLNESHQLSPLHKSTFSISVRQLVPAINEGLVMDDEEEYPKQNYPSHVLSMHALEQFHSYLEAIVEEFETLPDFQSNASSSHSPSKASMAAHSLFHPPPTTRVPLAKVSLDNQHGFLNASYVRGYGRGKYTYIATGAPWGSSLIDFWQMVWEQQSRTIICLCSPEEMGVVCPWYWPRDEGIQAAQLYGDILVMRQGCVLTENYTMSTLLVKNIQQNLCRPISHFWFTQWPVVSSLVPSSPMVLLSFLLHVRQTVQETYGPIIAHCSDGLGRTGTLLSIDSGMRSMEDLCTVDVPSLVCSIRHDRGSAVLERNHYAFIYKTLFEYSVMLTRGIVDDNGADVDGLDADASQC